MPTKYANKAVRENEEYVIADMERAKANPIAWAGIPNKPAIEKELKSRKEKLARITPPDVSGDEALQVKRRHDLLKNAMLEGKEGLVPAMPTQREMEQAPAGAVDKHLNFEMFWKRHNLDKNGKIVPIVKGQQRGLTVELKDCMRILGKGSEEYSPNIANLEIYRRKDDNVPLADSFLGRSYGLSLQAKENYDKAFPDHKPTEVENKLYKRSSKIPCQATKTNGKPCKGKATIGSPFCSYHKEFEPVLDAKIPTTEAVPLGG